MTRTLHRLFDGYSYLECPRWRDGRVWASDFFTHSVLVATPGSPPAVVVEVPGQPAGLGWLPGGDLLIVSMHDRKLLRWDGEQTSVHAELSDLAPSHLNDLVVDDRGRAFVGNFGSDMLAGEPLRSTNLIRVDPDGTATSVAEDLLCPNGMVITPDGTLIVAETFAGRLTAFDIVADGSLTNRRIWAALSEPVSTTDLGHAMQQLTVIPDGLAFDSEGATWVADGRGRRAIRVLDGEIVDEVSTAAEGLLTVACALGGEDGRTLFLCANPGPDEQHTTLEEASVAAMGAALLRTTVDVPHAGRP